MCVKNLTLLLLAALFLYSCRNNEKGKDVNETQEISLDLSDWDKFSGETFDSLFVSEVETNIHTYKQLSEKDVEFLADSYRWPTIENIYHYDVFSDYFPERRVPTLENQDIQIDSIHAFRIGYRVTSEGILAFWGITYKSVEACPYFHGTDIFMSYLSGSLNVNTVKIASNWSVSDPPLFVSAPVESHFEGLNLKMKYKQSEFETDETERLVAHYSEDFDFSFKNGMFR